MTDPTCARVAGRKAGVDRLRLRRPRLRHDRPRLRVGAALRHVLQGDRLRRHAAHGPRADGRRRSTTAWWSASTPTCPPGLPWRFQAEIAEGRGPARRDQDRVLPVKNTGATPSTGIATFNVQPGLMGSYFVKIECFCFNEQTLQPGETMDFPVVFYIDPERAQGFEHRASRPR